MTALYTAELGSHVFEVMPIISPRTTDVMRFNLTPVRCVARIYEIPLDCMTRAATPAAALADLSTVLAASVGTGTLPTFLKIKDSAGAVIPGIGDIREGTSEKWEDLELLQFELPPGVEQLVSGTKFRLVFRARRSFPDANGVCEFKASRKLEADELGRSVRRLRCEIRLDKAVAAAGTISVETTTAIRALVTEPKPVAGWIRTLGNLELPFEVDYPEWPLTHVAITESEVTRNRVAAGTPTPPPDAVQADLGSRRVEDPSRGLARTTTSAETTAPNPLPWVEGKAPSGDLVSAEIELEGTTAKGEWKSLARLGNTSPETRTHRRFALRGAGRRAGVIEMSGGIAARVQVGPFVAVRLREEIDVYAMGPASLEEVKIPPPLSGGWLLDGASVSDVIGISEDARSASQRLWMRAVSREYLWLGTDDPLASIELNAAIAAGMAETL